MSGERPEKSSAAMMAEKEERKDLLGEDLAKIKEMVMKNRRAEKDMESLSNSNDSNDDSNDDSHDDSNDDSSDEEEVHEMMRKTMRKNAQESSSSDDEMDLRGSRAASAASAASANTSGVLTVSSRDEAREIYALLKKKHQIDLNKEENAHHLEEDPELLERMSRAREIMKRNEREGRKINEDELKREIRSARQKMSAIATRLTEIKMELSGALEENYSTAKRTQETNMKPVDLCGAIIKTSDKLDKVFKDLEDLEEDYVVGRRDAERSLLTMMNIIFPPEED